MYTISVVIFFGLLALAIYKDRKNIEFKYILFVRRTKKGIKFLDRIAKAEKFWKIFGTIGVIVAFYLMINGFWQLSNYGRGLLTGEIKSPGVSFIFPTPTSQPSIGPGFILIPFWFWIIIIISVMFPHEIMHGIMSRVEKIRVKSAGVLLFAIFPGAFVEPDEKQIKKSGVMAKLRIFAAGSFANFIVSTAVFFLVAGFLWSYYVPGTVIISEVNSTGVAAAAGLKTGMVINSINGTAVKASYSEIMAGSYLYEELAGLEPGGKIPMTANNTNFTIDLSSFSKNQTVSLGMNSKPLIVNGDEGFVMGILFQLLTWMWMLNLAIAVVNILPLYPLDGGLMVQTVAEKINKKYSKLVTFGLTFITLAVFVINFVTPFLLA